MKWEMPLSRADSCRPPTPAQIPTAAVSTWGISQVADAQSAGQFRELGLHKLQISVVDWARIFKIISTRARSFGYVTFGFQSPGSRPPSPEPPAGSGEISSVTATPWAIASREFKA